MSPEAGDEYGQAAVYTAAVEYDSDADEWSVTDDRFNTEWTLYLANQDIWIGQWGGGFYRLSRASASGLNPEGEARQRG